MVARMIRVITKIHSLQLNCNVKVLKVLKERWLAAHKVGITGSTFNYALLIIGNQCLVRGFGLECQ